MVVGGGIALHLTQTNPATFSGHQILKEREHFIHIQSIHVLMRDEKEGRKKQARSNKQTRQSNTAHCST